MCGKESNLFRTNIEGTILNVCKDCSKFGKVLSPVVEESIEKKQKPVKGKIAIEKLEPEIVETIVANYGELIKNKREKLGIKQEDFAKKINEKVSLIHKIETNQFEPSLKLARKIEKFLKIKLIEQNEIKNEKLNKTETERLTIGDLIGMKK